MNRVIKDYSKLNPEHRDEVYIMYSEGDIERTSFPFKGEIVDGVIYQEKDIVYLVPISSIIAWRSIQTSNLENDEEQPSEMDDDVEIDWNEE